MGINYLPFQRREMVVVPSMLAARVLPGGFAVTNIARMASGSTKRAIVQDIIVYSADQQYQGMGNQVRMRIGVDGRNYLTEDLYDYRIFADMHYPMKAIWDWSCSKKTPYRLYPGQKMTVLMQRSHFWNEGPQNPITDIPISIMFNGMKVPWDSPVGTKEGEPIMLYATLVPPATTAAGDLIALDSPRLNCPKDSPVDLYSVTIPEVTQQHPNAQIVYILDGNERPFWDSTQFADMISILASPISMGYEGILLDPDETLRVELENSNAALLTDQHMIVTYRGVLEVDDGR